MCFSFGPEQTQKLTVKPRGFHVPPTSLPFEEDELVLCFHESHLEKLTAVASSFILHESFPFNKALRKLKLALLKSKTSALVLTFRVHSQTPYSTILLGEDPFNLAQRHLIGILQSL